MVSKQVLFFLCITFSFLSFSQVKNVNRAEEYTNALIGESSPYLLEHAHNPVDWYPWGMAALEKAKRENKLMIISIGYAACHWCHVMERETFSDTAVANFMNKHFISVKVDREERPDVDQVYMDAVQIITGQGGWPLNAFALPDGLPFHAGTYFPRDQWLQLLKLIAKTYANNKEKVNLQAAAIRDGMESQGVIPSPERADLQFKMSDYQTVFKKWEPLIDFEWGGYDRTPKFPQPATWESLLQFHYITGDASALRAVTTTLDKMSLGGIYDHINGGFARYSTDRNWKVPHFEKMLYDNGQLVSLYAHAYQLTGKKHYADIVRETLGFTGRELTTPEGGFYSSLNADSEGEEGKFYVWTQDQVDRALTRETASVISSYFQVTEEGNWENGKNILHAMMLKDDFTRKNRLGEATFDKTLITAKETLRKVQSSRIRPSTDDKVLTSWNAIMMKGYIDGYRALGKPEYLASAIKSASFLEKNMMKGDSGLWRNYKNGKTTIPGFLDDFALLADAYIELYQVTFDIHWLKLAQHLTSYAIRNFFDQKSGMFFYVSNQSKDLVIRKMETVDGAIPSSNSVMAHNLLRLGTYFYNEDYLTRARTMVANLEKEILKDGSYYAHWVRLFGLMAAEPYEIAIVGSEYQQKTRSFQKQYLPTSLFSGGELENLPLLEMKLIPGKTTIYVCRNKVCKLPVNDVPQAMKLLVR